VTIYSKTEKNKELTVSAKLEVYCMSLKIFCQIG